MRTYYHCINLKDKDMMNLVKGVRLEFSIGKIIDPSIDEHIVNIYPPHHGIILTNKDIKELKRLAAESGDKKVINYLFKTLKWGD